jgi:hypothetical protein
MTTRIQAWEIKSPEFSGYVYDQAIALRKWGESKGPATMEILTIVRYEDGSREYLKGVMA